MQEKEHLATPWAHPANLTLERLSCSSVLTLSCLSASIGAHGTCHVPATLRMGVRVTSSPSKRCVHVCACVRVCVCMSTCACARTCTLWERPAAAASTFGVRIPEILRSGSLEGSPSRH